MSASYQKTKHVSLHPMDIDGKEMRVMLNKMFLLIGTLGRQCTVVSSHTTIRTKALAFPKTSWELLNLNIDVYTKSQIQGSKSNQYGGLYWVWMETKGGQLARQAYPSYKHTKRITTAHVFLLGLRRTQNSQYGYDATLWSFEFHWACLGC